jgi:hypothetical protein
MALKWPPDDGITQKPNGGGILYEARPCQETKGGGCIRLFWWCSFLEWMCSRAIFTHYSYVNNQQDGLFFAITIL